MKHKQLELPIDGAERSIIERLKSQIYNNALNNGNMFSGDGPLFQVAIKEVKAELQGRYVFEYQRAADVYTVSQVQS